MPTILIAWELGGGLGHAARIVRLAKELKVAGHSVVMAIRELPRIAGLCDDSEFTLLQSPVSPDHSDVTTPRTFAHILWDSGFGNAAELQAQVDRWSKLFDSAKADLVVFDHAPTALLAARDRDMKRVVLGTGFSCPPDCSPLPDLRPWMPHMREQLLLEERHVLNCMNQTLKRSGAKPLERVSQLYGEVDDTFLTTLAEFDHYRNRQSARYRGPWPLPGGEPPVWPDGAGKRIYAYLSPSPVLPRVLQALRSTGCPTIVFGGLDQQIRDRFAAPNIRFETRRLDLRQVAVECDVAVLNGGQATTISFHLAGKPILQVPMYLEQGINAMNTERLGAGLMAFPRGVDRTTEQLAELLDNPSYTEAARRFAARYASFSADAEIAVAVQRLNELASKSA